jgi:hypothetical protein
VSIFPHWVHPQWRPEFVLITFPTAKESINAWDKLDSVQ